MSDPPSLILRRGRHRRVRAGLASDEGRSERKSGLQRVNYRSAALSSSIYLTCDF